MRRHLLYFHECNIFMFKHCSFPNILNSGQVIPLRHTFITDETERIRIIIARNKHLALTTYGAFFTYNGIMNICFHFMISIEIRTYL